MQESEMLQSLRSRVIEVLEEKAELYERIELLKEQHDLDIARYQVDDGYSEGYLHGQLAAARAFQEWTTRYQESFKDVS